LNHGRHEQNKRDARVHPCPSACGGTIGKRFVIGAGSVVRDDIPPYSVAVGSPAKVIKKYDLENKEWLRA